MSKSSPEPSCAILPVDAHDMQLRVVLRSCSAMMCAICAKVAAESKPGGSITFASLEVFSHGFKPRKEHSCFNIVRTYSTKICKASLGFCTYEAEAGTNLFSLWSGSGLSADCTAQCFPPTFERYAKYK